VVKDNEEKKNMYVFSKDSEEEEEPNREPQGEELKKQQNEEDEEDQMSDYIDENFEIDETDEHWNKDQLSLK
jgi:hypothetical protein